MVTVPVFPLIHGYCACVSLDSWLLHKMVPIHTLRTERHELCSDQNNCLFAVDTVASLGGVPLKVHQLFCFVLDPNYLFLLTLKAFLF